MKLSLALILATLPFSKITGQVETLGKLTFSGEILEAEDLSAVATVGDSLLIASDEGTSLQVLRPSGPLSYSVDPARNHLLFESETELDSEGIARDGATYFLIGSHSLKRKLLDPELSARENRARMEEIDFEPSRLHLFRLELSEAGEVVSKRSVNLETVMARDPILSRFTQIPGKENGVDIEAVAVTTKGKEDPKIYLGFRSPVLRENFTPVMVMKFSNPTDYELRFVPLGGLGIREMQKVEKGFLIIAGPSGGAPGSFHAFYWDGDGGLPDHGKIKSKVRLLGEIPTPPGGKAEGMTLLEETDDHYDVIIVYDGVPMGAPEKFRIHKKGKGGDEPAFTKETDE